jgi:hypothetical protein
MNLISQKTSSSDATTACALAAGMILGAGFALLFAPRRGVELRAELGRRFNFDRNELFRKRVEAEGGLPGPVKHLGP